MSSYQIEQRWAEVALQASALHVWKCENNRTIRKVTKSNLLEDNIHLLNNVTRMQCCLLLNMTAQKLGQCTAEGDAVEEYPRAITGRICIGRSRAICGVFLIWLQCKQIHSSWEWGHGNVPVASYFETASADHRVPDQMAHKAPLSQSGRVYVSLIFALYTLLSYLKSIWKCCYLSNDLSWENGNWERIIIEIWTAVSLDVKLNVSRVPFILKETFLSPFQNNNKKTQHSVH